METKTELTLERLYREAIEEKNALIEAILESEEGFFILDRADEIQAKKERKIQALIEEANKIIVRA